MHSKGPSINQRPALDNIQSDEERKMAQAFSNNDNSTIIVDSFNTAVPNDESKILAWLSPLEPRARHRDIVSQRVDGIGNWLLETEEFRRWYKGSGGDEANHATLFCDGNPGVGKSHIISLVIDKLCDETVKGDTAVTCFYFDFAARNEQSPLDMLGSLLGQLVNGLEEIPEAAVEGFRNQKKAIGGRGLQISGIVKMFQTIADKKSTFICVDALDECVPEHRVVVLESLGQILQGSPNTRLFMTGRPHIRSEVEMRLEGGVSFVLIQLTEDDIVSYLREKLKKDTTPRIMNRALEENIVKSIPGVSSETFLLASLHIGAVLRETTIARRGRKLKSLKDGAGLGGAYGATLERIKAQDEEKRKLAIATLTWICHAERPLQVDELCHALAVEIGAEDFDHENVPSIDTLLGCCQGLITVDKEASTVRLIHFTVQEYLCAHPDLFCKPHTIIAETCLAYLNSRQVKDLPTHPLPDHQSMPFLKYSSRYWGAHANKELTEHVLTLALELLTQCKDHVSSVSLLEQVIRPTYFELVGVSPLFSGLHCASFFGIVELVAALMGAEDCDINQQDRARSTPLLWAAWNGHEGVTKLLLDREDIDPNRSDLSGQTPLGCAAMEGHEGVVKLLLEQENIDPNCLDEDDRTPLGYAAIEGHKGIVRLLLERGIVNPDRPDKYSRTPLGYATIKGHEGIVRLLLGQENVDPNRPDGNDRTLIGCVAIEGHERILSLLLERENIDPNSPDKYNQTPLGHAAIKGHEGVVKILLEQENVDPNRSDKNDRTPLGWAAIKGHEGVVKLLLERENVDPNHLDIDGRIPLACAATNGHEGAVKILLDLENVDPNRVDKHGLTPLGCAASNGHEGVIKLLLEQENVDPNHPDIGGRIPLACAARNGHEGVVKILLDLENVDPNHPDIDGQTPLGCAASNGHEGVVILLLELENVDPNHPDIDGQTPLGSAASNGHEGVVRIFLERENVDPNHPGIDGRTPLGCAARNGSEGAARILLGRANVDPDRRDKFRLTPLLWASIRGHEGVVELLLERSDLDPNRPDAYGRTPLLHAALCGREGVVKLLRGRKDVDSNRLDKYGRTPLSCAILEGHQGVVKLLLEGRDVDPNLQETYDQRVGLDRYRELWLVMEDARRMLEG